MVKDDRLKLLLKWGKVGRSAEIFICFVMLVLLYYFRNNFEGTGLIFGGLFVFFTLVRTGMHNIQIRGLIRYIDNNK